MRSNISEFCSMDQLVLESPASSLCQQHLKEENEHSSWSQCCYTSDQSHSKKYETHKIRTGARGNFYPVVFNDVMGLEEETGRGVRPEDIKLAMMGHVKDGYKFNPTSSLAHGDPGYNPRPSLDDKVHVLVCVHSANSAEIKASTLQKMKEIREVANDLGIPQLAVVTKVDEACRETEKDLRNIYKSKHIKKR
ncbi:hypothetical protein INR49_006736 [Caranx melampygus]|nr:hypothetical protein INR49_006736 [Caranx melampygus]